MRTLIQAREDATLGARIMARHELHYRAEQRETGSAAADTPRFVRAGSSLSWFAGKLAVVQDDALFVGLIDAHSFEVEALALPLRADGARSFDVVRGNKRDKPDFEACFAASFEGAPALFALGSGSHPNRESVALVVERAGQLSARIVHVPRLYAALRACPGFLSSELNLEGAVLLGDTLRLFQRSNGAILAGAAEARCATCDLPLAELEAHLLDPARAAVPELANVCRYDLGRIGAARLTFTDAALRSDGTLLYSASAESSPNAYDDGSVSGSALGVLDAEGARYTLMRDAQGEIALDKAEGLALPEARTDRALVIFDPDDHTRPACLADVALRGF